MPHIRHSGSHYHNAFPAEGKGQKSPKTKGFCRRRSSKNTLIWFEREPGNWNKHFATTERKEYIDNGLSGLSLGTLRSVAVIHFQLRRGVVETMRAFEMRLSNRRLNHGSGKKSVQQVPVAEVTNRPLPDPLPARVSAAI